MKTALYQLIENTWSNHPMSHAADENKANLLLSFGSKSVLETDNIYSYGEISPFNEGGNCQFHNQTMTITSFYED